MCGYVTQSGFAAFTWNLIAKDSLKSVAEYTHILGGKHEVGSQCVLCIYTLS